MDPGSWLSLMLKLLGAEVYGYSLEAPTEPSVFEILGLKEKIHSEIGDVRDFEHLKGFLMKQGPRWCSTLRHSP